MKTKTLYGLVLLLPLTLSSCASTAPRETREQYVAELIQAVGMEDLLARTQQRSAAESRRMVEGMLGQAGDIMAKLSADQRERLKAAVDRMMATLTASLDAKDAAAAWGRFYSAQLSDDELRHIVEYSRTPLGRKEQQASAAAADQLRTYLLDKRAPVMQKAVSDYVTELRAIVASGSGAAPRKP